MPYSFRCITFGSGTTYVEVPRARAYADPALRWCLQYAPASDARPAPQDPDTGRHVVRVPVTEWDARMGRDG